MAWKLCYQSTKQRIHIKSLRMKLIHNLIVKRTAFRVLLILLLLSGCTGIYNFEKDAYKPKVVVESFLHPDSLIKVTLSWNRPVEDTTDIKYIDGASVQIEEEGVLIVNGTTVNGVLASQVYPSVGKHYRLKVMVSGEPEMGATTYIPPTADIRFSVREKRGASGPTINGHTISMSGAPQICYTAVDVSSITLPPGLPAVWISGHMKYDDGTIDQGNYGSIYNGHDKELYSNCPYLDQVNTSKDATDVSLRESNTIFERGFIRIECSALSLAIPFTFSVSANWASISYKPVWDGNEWDGSVTEVIGGPFAEQFMVRLRAPSVEYDQYRRSAMKQDLTYGVSPLFVYDPVHIFSNIRNGMGIFAGYNTSEISVTINNPYK